MCSTCSLCGSWWRGHYTVNKHHPSDETLNWGPDSLWSLKIQGCSSKNSLGVTPVFRPNLPIGLDHHGLLIIPIHRLASLLCILSTSKLVYGGRSGALWLPSHHPGGCCTLVVVEEIPHFYVKRSEYSEKRYKLNVNYYYYSCDWGCNFIIYYYYYIIFINPV